MNKVIPILLTLLFIESGYTQQKKYSLAQVEIKNKVQMLNTFDSIFIPSCYYKPPKLKIFFTEEEQKKIIELADSFQFWDLPDTVQSSKNSQVMPCHCPCTLTISTRKKNKTILFDCTFEDDSYRLKVRGLQNAIMEIVYEKSEYKALPPCDFFYE